MTMKTINYDVSVDIDVDLSEFTTEELIEELNTRNDWLTNNEKSLLERIWLLRREGKDFDKELSNLLYQSLGKIV